MNDESPAIANTVRIVLDRDCPGCGWPEIVAVGTLSHGPEHMECCRPATGGGAGRVPCGWREDVASASGTQVSSQ